MHKLIGTKQFYKSTLTIALPIMIQNAVTNLVSLLDNIMVGQCGLEALSGVAIISQLMFVYFVTVFGATSGPGLFCAQFFGARDEESLRAAFRFKLATALLVCAVAMLILFMWPERIISLYINDTGSGGDPQLMLQHARRYLDIVVWSMPAFAVAQSYASTLREVGQTRVPMLASCIAVSLNLLGNWVLIFGKLGFPELGIIGTAIATVISRWVEMAFVIVWSHRHSAQVVFPRRLFQPLSIASGLFRRIAVKSMPLFCNELLWSLAQAFLLQMYSLRGLNVVASLNISYVFLDLCDVVCFSMGSAIGIIVGQLLGAGKLEEAVDTDHKLIAFTAALSFVIMIIMAISASYFPLIYEVPPEVRQLASSFILICAFMTPIEVLPHTFYFTLRSGGKTFITFLFDSAFSWAVNVPVVFILVNYTAIPVTTLYLCSLLTGLVKCAVGWIMVKRRIWVVNLAQKKSLP
ncbi:MAG: MATE family efflux transporter [Firmicutes bacterium]|nr:MATE family efflux transporter [Bacillota bacterium]